MILQRERKSRWEVWGSSSRGVFSCERDETDEVVEIGETEKLGRAVRQMKSETIAV